MHCPPDCRISSTTTGQRESCARAIRRYAADREKQEFPKIPGPNGLCNGDEVQFQNSSFIASYSKGLPHTPNGEVNSAAYQALLDALCSGKQTDFDAIPLGCSGGAAMKTMAPDWCMRGKQSLLVNPQSAFAYDLEGFDPHSARLIDATGNFVPFPPAPKFDSLEEVGEISENFWMALSRDIPFTQYATNPTIAAAAADLAAFLPNFAGPTTATQLFRGVWKGDEKGPYISQFLLKEVPYGAQRIDAKILTVAKNVDYMTTWAKWLKIQNGCMPSEKDQCDTFRYIRNGRDLGQFVHVDVLFQAYFNALLILLAPDKPMMCQGVGLGNPVTAGNPYHGPTSTAGGPLKEMAFGTFGSPHIASLLGEVASRALKAVWYQKWSVHRRLRPEEFAGRIHSNIYLGTNHPINAAGFTQLTSPTGAVHRIQGKHGSALLPMAFPEGCPLHPAYASGHATVGGACVTLLKAWFDGSVKIKNPVVPSPDGKALVPYTGGGAGSLTIEGELNKLSSNIALGRNFAGVHWRSDYMQGQLLGEAVAISLLWDQACTYNEKFEFTFNSFRNIPVRINKQGVYFGANLKLPLNCPC